MDLNGPLQNGDTADDKNGDVVNTSSPNAHLDYSSRLPAQPAWVFRGCLVHSTAEQEMSILEDTAIGVRDGKILFVEPADNIQELLTTNDISEDRVVRMTDSQFLMPGLVDCHAHAPQYSFLGTGTDLQLLDWLSRYTFPAEARLQHQEDAGLSVYHKCVDRTLKCGTTTVSYFATIHTRSTMALVDVLEMRGQRALVGKVNMDRNGGEDYVETTEESIKETERFISDMLLRKSTLVRPCITPRFAVSCSMPLMEKLSELATAHKLPIQTHASENLNEIKFVSELFPECASYCDVYRKAGLLGPKTMLAHAVHLSQGELNLIRDTGSGICHCPNSNFNLSSGVMDLRKVLDMGIKVGLGTDFAGGHSPSMLDAIRRGMDAVKVKVIAKQEQTAAQDELTGSNNHQDSPITYKHLFRLATLGSSQVMGLDDVIGNFMVGKDFDALLVDANAPGSPVDVFPTDSKEDIIQKFIFLGDDRNITRVFVQGRQVIGPGGATVSCSK